MPGSRVPRLKRSASRSRCGGLGTRHEALTIEHPRGESQCERIDRQQANRTQQCDGKCRMDHTDRQQHDHAKNRKTRERSQLLGDADFTRPH